MGNKQEALWTVESWTDKGMKEQIAITRYFAVGLAAWEAAKLHLPNERMTFCHGARILQKHNEPT